MNTIKILSGIFIILSSTFTATAQTGNNIIKIGGNVLGLFSEGESETYGGGSLSVEHLLKRKTALCLNVDFNTKKEEIADGTITVKARLNITTIEPEIRFYVSQPLNGFYFGIAPALHIFKSKISGTITLTDSESRFGLGAKAGYQFRLSSRVLLQAGAGLGGFIPKEDEDFTGRYNFNLLLGIAI